MKSITFSADQDLIERARAAAKARGTTLNVMFQEWVSQLVAASETSQDYEALMKRLSHLNFGGRKFTRDEMNERR